MVERGPRRGISIDSRSVAPGDLFIALKGPSFDGHAYVVDALKKAPPAQSCIRRFRIPAITMIA